MKGAIGGIGESEDPQIYFVLARGLEAVIILQQKSALRPKDDIIPMY